MAYARGKHAQFISDRSGIAFPYKEMVREWNGSRVHESEYEPKTAQDHPRKHSPDGEALQFPFTPPLELLPALVPLFQFGLLIIPPFYNRSPYIHNCLHNRNQDHIFHI